MKLRLSLFSLLIAALLLTLTAPAGLARQEVTVASVNVDIWPEYDQPSVLVIYNITLSSQETITAPLTVRIPAAAGQPHAVAVQAPDGLYNLDYELTPAGEWVEVSFTPLVPDVRIEYYDPGLVKDGSSRSFTFRWPGDFTVENLTLQIQQPVSVDAMTFRPDIGTGRVGSDGFTYYTQVLNRVEAGRTFDLSFSYEKTDDTLTVTDQYQPVSPARPVEDAAAGTLTSPNGWIPWAIGAFGLLLIAGGSVWYWRTGRTPRAEERAQRNRHRHRSAEAASQSGEGIFCHQCGKKGSPGDLFCRACGTRLRE